MPTSAATGTHSVKAGGAKSTPKSKSQAKASKAKAIGPVPNDNGFHRTRSYTKDDGTLVIQELWANTWVDVEERPRTNGWPVPVHKVPGGYQWGNHGKVYPTKAQAARQGRAAYAHGYRGENKPRAKPRKRK